MDKRRRTFVKQVGVLGMAPVMLGGFVGCKEKTMKSTVEEAVKAGFTLKDFGIQLWSVKDAMYADPKQTLIDLGRYGYNHVESFQGDMGVFWGMEAKEFKTFLTDNNLEIHSTHCSSDYTLVPEKEDEFKQFVEDAAGIGLKHLVNPWMGNLKTIDDFKRATDGLNRCGEIAKSAGLTYNYHNHAYSFKAIDGTIPQDIMMKGTEGGPVQFEMDIYWVVAAGQDPIEWLNKYAGRWSLSHVKDRYKAPRLDEIAKEEEVEDYSEIKGSCVLGTGQINFNEVLQVAKDQGMEYYIVEQERYDDMTSMEASELNATFMKQYQS